MFTYNKESVAYRITSPQARKGMRKSISILTSITSPEQFEAAFAYSRLAIEQARFAMKSETDAEEINRTLEQAELLIGVKHDIAARRTAKNFKDVLCAH